MGNAHGHRRHRNGPTGSLRDKPASPAFKYGSADHAAQIPSSTATKANSMVSFPYSHVDSSLRALASQAEGFGRLAIGGLHGPLYRVTTFAGHLHPPVYELNYVCKRIFVTMGLNFRRLDCVFGFEKVNCVLGVLPGF